MLAPWKDSYDKLIILKDRDITLPTKVPIFKAMIIPVVRYWCEMWFIKEGEHQRIDGFEPWSWRRFLRVPWIARIKSVNPKGNQPRIFIGMINAEAPILWLPDTRNQLIGKDPKAGKDWGQEEKDTTEDKMIGWHHQLNGHEFEQILGDNEGQGRLVCCSPQGCKELETTQQGNNHNSFYYLWNM